MEKAAGLNCRGPDWCSKMNRDLVVLGMLAEASRSPLRKEEYRMTKVCQEKYKVLVKVVVGLASQNSSILGIGLVIDGRGSSAGVSSWDSGSKGQNEPWSF